LKGYKIKYAFVIILTLPLSTIVFYRNSFPYYFVFILPLALFTANIVLNNLNTKENFTKNIYPKTIFIIFVFMSLFNAGKIIIYYAHDRTFSQRQLLVAVHDIFKNPVPYIDRNRMISSFPNVGIWMSTWGIESYRNAGKPIMEKIIREQQPVFMLANTPALKIEELELYGNEKHKYRLFDEDYQILKKNYIHHWGIIYVAGKKFDGLSSDEVIHFEILIDGVYTVESEGKISIDGNTYFQDDIVYLEIGKHQLNSINATNIILRWGDHLKIPDQTASSYPIYTGL
jgi:hypothetical protein